MSRVDKIKRMQVKSWQMLDNKTCRATRKKNKRMASKYVRKEKPAEDES